MYAPLRKTLSNAVPQRLESEIRRFAELVVFRRFLCREVFGQALGHGDEFDEEEVEAGGAQGAGVGVGDG